MTNKIVILQNSVELYEHYINDQRWERTLSFPRGGLTYLISNGTIKFYAYEDYFYRNCLMSMQLPVHIINEDEHIDGMYDDVDEIVDILDEIFPVNDIDIELMEYLKIRDAELLYQPIGDYVTTDELDEVLEDYYTKDEVDDLLDDKADKDDVYTKEEADDRFQPKGDYVSADTFSAYTAETAAELSGKADADDVYTKTESDERFQPIGDYVSADTFSAYTAQTDAAIQDLDDRKADKSQLPDMTQYYRKSETSSKTQIEEALNLKADKSNTYTKNEVYNKQESDNKYQVKGSYVSTSVYNTYTATTNEVIISLEENKLDASAYTPVDLSNYYTKIEVDNKIASGGTFDPTQYYNKSEADDRFALKREIPSLSGYATMEWVLNQNYVTTSTVQQYITNLQQQINSIIQSVSGCCSQTGETIYRWITLTGPNDFICSGTTKFEKQQRQQSTDNGMTWTNVSPAQYQKGALLETDSPDCGYAPEPQYRWKAAPTSDYLCSGTSKYYKVYYEVSYDNGSTWQHVVPEQTKRGDLIQANSPDCGYIAPQYRWYTLQNQYLCSGTTKYEKQVYQVSYDNAASWQNVSPEQSRTGAVIETESTDCGYIAPQYRWYTAQNEYLCSGTTKYQKQYYQVSYNNGVSWQNVSPTQTRTGSVIEVNSTDCGYVEPTPKYKLTLRNGTVESAACDSTSSLRQNEIQSYSANTVSAVIGECVSVIDQWAFWNFQSLSSVTIPNSVTTINTYGFGDCFALSSVTIPNSMITIGSDAFAYCSGLTSVTIPNNVTTIGSRAFYDCRGIRSLTIGSSVTSIGGSAFNLCENLTTVTIPSSVVEIGTGAFNQCLRLATVTSMATTPPTMGNGVFDETAISSIRVPSGSVSAYRAADGWKKYANIITAI